MLGDYRPFSIIIKSTNADRQSMFSKLQNTNLQKWKKKCFLSYFENSVRYAHKMCAWHIVTAQWLLLNSKFHWLCE